jgi:DNA-binding transcriptional ArsR family regulator
MSKLDLLVHPIRLRIITVLAGKSLTPAQMGQQLSDVPQASLYRHINQLLEGGIIRVVEERPNRGTLEKVYQLVAGASQIATSDMKDMSDDDHLNYFMIFLSTLLQDFSSHLENSTHKMQDVTYNKVILYLTDAEHAELANQIRALLMPYITDPQDTAHKRHLFSFINIPEE